MTGKPIPPLRGFDPDIEGAGYGPRAGRRRRRGGAWIAFGFVALVLTAGLAMAVWGQP